MAVRVGSDKTSRGILAGSKGPRVGRGHVAYAGLIGRCRGLRYTGENADIGGGKAVTIDDVGGEGASDDCARLAGRRLSCLRQKELERRGRDEGCIGGVSGLVESHRIRARSLSRDLGLDGTETKGNHVTEETHRRHPLGVTFDSQGVRATKQGPWAAGDLKGD